MNPAPGFDPAHTQAEDRVRCDWGPTGADALTQDAGAGPGSGPGGSGAGGVHVAVVVDVLSFTTTLSVAVQQGMEVFPYRWRDERAQAYAVERDAVLAVGRLEARASGGGVSLSPAYLAAVEGVARIVLPSPNGSAISFRLADSGAVVVGASLRNATAVATWVAARIGADGSVAVIAAGERWPDGTLRPAVEDLWGAGAVLAALATRLPEGGAGFSAEARVAQAAYGAVCADLAAELADCAGGRELVALGFAADVVEAARLDCSQVVPVLRGESFRDAADSSTPARDPRL